MPLNDFRITLVHNPRVVDLATANPGEKVFRLIMIEAEPWASSEELIRQLVEKVNSYLTFVQSGQCAELYPGSGEMDVIFQLDHITPLPADVLMVIHQLDLQLRQHDLSLVTNRLEDSQ